MTAPKFTAAFVLKRTWANICLTSIGTALFMLFLTSSPGAAQSYDQNANKASTSGAPLTRMPWQRDLRQAMKEAKESGKMILIDVYTDWCGPCKKLDADTYTNPEVLTYLTRTFICVKVNAEDPKLGYWVSSKYGIDAYPSIIVLSPDRKMKGKFSSYLPPRQFLAAVNQLATR